MEFFYEKISKVKNNLIIFLTIIGIIMINDIVIWKFSSSKSKVNQKDNDIQLSYKDEIDKSGENDNLSSKEFMIDVKGEVKNPGVYLVNEQMNVNDAIKLAGGIKKSASTDTINLSRKLKDQMVIIVPKKDTNKQTNTNNITSNDNISKNNSNQFIKQEDIKNDALIVQNDLINNSTQANEQSNLLKDSNQDQWPSARKLAQ